jgi:hypothetical protein
MRRCASIDVGPRSTLESHFGYCLRRCQCLTGTTTFRSQLQQKSQSFGGPTARLTLTFAISKSPYSLRVLRKPKASLFLSQARKPSMSGGDVASGRRPSSSLRRAQSTALRKLRRAAAVSVAASALLAGPPPMQVRPILSRHPLPQSPTVQPSAAADGQRPEFEIQTISAGVFLGPSSAEQNRGSEVQQKRDDLVDHVQAVTLQRRPELSTAYSTSADIHVLWRIYATFETSVQDAGGVLYTGHLTRRISDVDSEGGCIEEESCLSEWHDCG